MNADRLRWLDYLLAAALTAAGVAITLDPANGDGTVLDSLVIAAVTLPVVWWRRAPLAAAAALSVGIVVSGIPTFDQTRCGVAIPAALLILFSLAVRRNRDPALGGLSLVLAAMVFLLFTDPQLGIGAAFVLPLCAGVWGAGRLVRSRNKTADELIERSRQLEVAREDSAQVAVEVERMRLASDLEVAARGRLTEMIELADGGQTAIDDDPQRAPEVFGAIEREGRASLNEMREQLGVLRSDEREVSPRPTLAQLETLLDAARSAGASIGLQVDGERRPLPDGVELAAYRMIQHALEALGTVRGGGAEVQLRYLDSAIELQVEGTIAAGSTADAALSAARERVTAHGGSFNAETGSGRMLLHARLPVVATGV